MKTLKKVGIKGEMMFDSYESRHKTVKSIQKSRLTIKKTVIRNLGNANF